MSQLTISEKTTTQDKLRVDMNKKQIKMTAALYKYRDRDTRQIVMFIPSLDITGYGADEKKAMEMLQFSIDEYFDWLVKKSHKQIETELQALGWKHIQYKNKEFSQTYVDGDGRLKNLNAVADKVERLTVVA